MSTRRTSRLILIAAVAAVLALSGCGSAPAGQDTDSENGQPGDSAIEATTGSVSDAYGEVPITSAKRVVAMSVSDAEAAVAAGVVPVAMAKAPVEPVMPWTKERIQELGAEDPELFEWSTEDTIPYEEIASWAPDMILATGNNLSQDAHRQLNEIAPTLTAADAKTADSWQQQAERVSTVIGHQEDGQQAIKNAESSIATASSNHPAIKGTTFLVANFHSQDEVGVLADADAATVKFFSELGLELAPVAKEMTADTVPSSLSLEKLDVLDAEVLVGYFPDPNLRAKYEKVPTFSSLPAVKGQHFYQPSDEEWRGLRSVSALSVPELADPIAAKIAEAVDGK